MQSAVKQAKRQLGAVAPRDLLGMTGWSWSSVRGCCGVTVNVVLSTQGERARPPSPAGVCSCLTWGTRPPPPSPPPPPTRLPPPPPPLPALPPPGDTAAVVPTYRSHILYLHTYSMLLLYFVYVIEKLFSISQFNSEQMNILDCNMKINMLKNSNKSK